jgi:ABC-2 type transport system ATP-binding protein
LDVDLNAPAIQCSSLTKVFRTAGPRGGGSAGLWRRIHPKKVDLTAVDGVDFTVPRGEIFGVLGPNGSGKSTLIRILSTLVFPDGGSARIFGLDVGKQAMQVRRYINRVSVDAAFFKKLSAWENLSYAARLYGVPVREARQRAEAILEEMGFARDRMNQSLEDLSRGMQQKVAIARALFTSPVLVLMDEPTTGLDPVSKRQVQDYVLRIRDRLRATVLLTSHDMDEAQRVCDRIAIIHHGKFIAMGTLDELRVQAECPTGSLEDIFFELTGKDLAHADLEQEVAEPGEDAA